MIRSRRLALLLLSLAFFLPAAASAAAAPLTAEEVRDWREDLRFVRTELVRRHPLLFAGLTPTHLTPARLDSAAAAIEAKIPRLRAYEVEVELEKLVALAGAGHTSINPLFDPRSGFRGEPVELGFLEDGLFVTRADPAHAGLAGARVIRIGKLAVDDAVRAVAPVISHENDAFLRNAAPLYLMIPEVAAAIGLTDDPETLPLEVEKAGVPHTIVLAPSGPLPLRGHGPDAADARRDWVGMRPASVPPPLFRSHGTPRWIEFLPEHRILYVAFQSSVDPGAVSVFFDRVLAAIDSLAPDRVVIDVRDNLGGDAYYNRKLVLGLIRHPAIDRPGHLFAIIGRGTYSAAQALVNDLERWTRVTFVGEPTGSPTAFFGDHEPVRLPHSGLTLNVSTLWWQPADPRDRRRWVVPRLAAEESSEDVLTGRDPAMECIGANLDTAPLGERLATIFASGDTIRAAAEVAAFRRDPVNRWVEPEVELNALGYSLLRSGRGPDAARVFRLAVRLFPRSANALDSLGECYEHAGFTAAAIDQYRAALALAPGLRSAEEALHRVGGAAP
jgi:hypothetical protein